MTFSDANFLKSRNLFFGFISGAQKVIQQQEELNRINVFPVADSDTGTNLGNTFSSVIHSLQPEKFCSDLFSRIGNSAIDGAKGNSGVIIAQFLHGLSCEIKDLKEVNLQVFADALKKSVQKMYEAVADPVEGTILTVIREWSEYFQERRTSTDNFFKVFEDSLEIAKKSLDKTAERMEVLRKSKFVDAGAKGFVLFLEGVMDFFKTGKVNRGNFSLAETPLVVDEEITTTPTFRYCTEGVITSAIQGILPLKVKEFLCREGDSVVVAGGENRLHFHVHTNYPARVMDFFIDQQYEVRSHKADDMLMQYNWKYKNDSPYVLLTDSASDLPQYLRDQFQIYQVSYNVEVDGISYMDRLSIQADEVYDLVQNPKHKISTAQVSEKVIRAAYQMGLSAGKRVIGVFTSSGLTGTYQTAQRVVKELKSDKLLAVDSMSISGSQAMLVLRIANALKSGVDFDQLKENISKWKKNLGTFVSISTVKYFIKGGRLSPLKGFVASLLNVKPLISVDENGKGIFIGKSFSRAGSFKLLKKEIRKRTASKGVWGYSITHTGENEQLFQVIEFMKNLFGKDAEFINEAAPALGVHAGPGCICIGLMTD